MVKQRAETKQADDLKWDECTEENINSKTLPGKLVLISQPAPVKGF